VDVVARYLRVPHAATALPVAYMDHGVTQLVDDADELAERPFDISFTTSKYGALARQGKQTRIDRCLLLDRDRSCLTSPGSGAIADPVADTAVVRDPGGAWLDQFHTAKPGNRAFTFSEWQREIDSRELPASCAVAPLDTPLVQRGPSIHLRPVSRLSPQVLPPGRCILHLRPDCHSRSIRAFGHEGPLDPQLAKALRIKQRAAASEGQQPAGSIRFTPARPASATPTSPMPPTSPSARLA
jgi:hypothetical protein